MVQISWKFLIAGAIIWIGKSIIFDWLKNRPAKSNGNGKYVDNKVYTELKLLASSSKKQEEILDSLNKSSIEQIVILRQISGGLNK